MERFSARKIKEEREAGIKKSFFSIENVSKWHLPITQTTTERCGYISVVFPCFGAFQIIRCFHSNESIWLSKSYFFISVIPNANFENMKTRGESWRESVRHTHTYDEGGAKGTDAEERSTDRRGMAGAKPLGRHRARSEEEKKLAPPPAPCAPSRVLSATRGRAALGARRRQRGLIAGALAPPSLRRPLRGRPGGRAGGGGRHGASGGAGARPRLRTQASDRRWTERPGPVRHQPGALGSPDPALHHLPL